MDGRSAFNLRDIPLHIVFEILCQLDSVQDLASAVLSHPVFHLAFQDSRDTTVRRIIANRIPHDLLPFAISLLECGNVPRGDAGVVRQLFTRLYDSIQNPAEAVSSLSQIPLQALKTISRHHTLVESLIQSLASSTIPLFNSKLGLTHPSDTSWRENFRIGRAFYRYLIMCALFGYRTDIPIVDEERDKLLFKNFSPWVNEQLVCVYAYLEQMGCLAFDDLAAHDVEYGALQIGWDDEPEDLLLLQEFLTYDLDFLHQVVGATDFESRKALMPPSNFKALNYEYYPTAILDGLAADTFIRDIVLQTGAHIDGFQGTVSVNPDLFKDVTYPADGNHDGEDSASFQTWCSAHLNSEVWNNQVFDATYCEGDKNLWLLGYVFWDCNEFDKDDMARKCEAANLADSFFVREYDWSIKTRYESQSQRLEINMKGGSGYWTPGVFDFSRVHGLREGDEEELLQKWGAERAAQANSASQSSS